MPPPLFNWKRLIDNGNSLDGPAGNVTEPVATSVPDDIVKRPQQQPQGGSGIGSDLLPVYCGLLGCLIVALIAWIVFKQLRRPPSVQENKLPQPVQTPMEEDVTDGHDHRQRHHHRYQWQAQQEVQQVLFHPPLVMSQKRKSTDSGFYGSEMAVATTAEVHIGADIKRRLLRDMSESRLQRLENILANDPNSNGWRRLAQELGLRAEDLTKLESRQSARGNQSAIRLMLKSWAARDSSSVGQLIRCLQRAGRSDALILFRESAQPQGLKRAHRKARKQQQVRQSLHLPTAEAAAAPAEDSGGTTNIANVVKASESPPSV